jgi:phosphotriesterase-related protein
VGDDELLVGAEVDDEEPAVVVVVLEPDVSDDALPLLEVEPAVLVPTALAPGWSWETTMPMATVAPVAATITPRVTPRSRALALSLWAGVLGWAGADMGAGSFVGRRTHPTMRISTPTQRALWSCCDLRARRTCRTRRPPLRSPGVRQTAQQQGEAMAQVNTVQGPVDGGRLGRTLMHEHIFVLSPEIEKTADEWDEAAEQARAVTKLRELKDRGIDTLVDLTVIGLGRYIPRVAAIAEQVPDINVVVATGVYTYNEVPMYFHFQGPGTILGGPEPMVDIFIREIRDGIGETGVRAGILKCASDRPGITPGVERVLRAVAKAHRATGVPITTHTPTPPEPWGLEQQRIFKEEGVDLTRVVIGHSGGTVNTDYHLSLIDNGSYLGFDHFGLPGITLEERVDAVARLCARGLADRIVLSHDAMCFVDWFPRSMTDAAGSWRWTYISDEVLPVMRARGISDADITTMLVDNPRTILEGGAPY